MSLFNNVTSLVDLFTQGSADDISAISNKAGIDAKQAGSIVTVGLPLILNAIKNNTQTPEGLESFNNALQQHQDDPEFDSLAQYAENNDDEDGKKMLNHIFQGQTGIFDQLGSTLGLSADSVQNVLAMIAPMLMKYFAGNMKNNGLSLDNILQQTASETNRAKELVQGDDLLGGLLGGVMDSVFGGQTQSTKNTTGGILKSVLDILKK